MTAVVESLSTPEQQVPASEAKPANVLERVADRIGKVVHFLPAEASVLPTRFEGPDLHDWEALRGDHELWVGLPTASQVAEARRKLLDNQ